VDGRRATHCAALAFSDSPAPLRLDVHVTRRQGYHSLRALCILAALWAYATVLTGGGAIHLGPWRLSSHNPRNPLMLSIASGLLAWWLSRAHARARTLRTTSRASSFLGLLLIAFAFEVLVLFRPMATGFLDYPLAIPAVFTNVPRVTRYALPLLLAIGTCVLAIATWKRSELVVRPRRTVAGIFLLGLVLHLAPDRQPRRGVSGVRQACHLGGSWGVSVPGGGRPGPGGHARRLRAVRASVHLSLRKVQES
jgi:hypothetical protein